METIQELEAGRTVADPPEGMAALFRPSVQPYLISWMKHDPAATLKELKIPAIIVDGSRDIQVTSKDGDLLAAARPDLTRVTIQDMNHVLKKVKNAPANYAAYSDPALPVAPELVRTIIEFIGTLKAAPQK